MVLVLKELHLRWDRGAPEQTNPGQQSLQTDAFAWFIQCFKLLALVADI